MFITKKINVKHYPIIPFFKQLYFIKKKGMPKLQSHFIFITLISEFLVYLQTQTVSELKDFVKKLNSLPEISVSVDFVIFTNVLTNYL